MNKTTVVIMGKAITIQYAVHEPAYVEWQMNAPVEGLEDEMELLNVLLRTHYSDFIESACREASFYNAYAATAAADDWMDSLRYTQGIRRGLFNPGDEEEDIPF